MTRIGGSRRGSSPRSPGQLGQTRGGAPWARFAVLGAIAVAVVLAGYLLISAIGGGSSCDDVYCETGETIALPSGLERLSAVYELNPEAEPPPEGFDLEITLPLAEFPAAGASVSFYRYEPAGDVWESIAPAALDAEGTQATGVFADPPRYLAVLRRAGGGEHVIAYLPGGRAPHPAAIEHATIVHTYDFTPGSDGAVEGELTSVTAGEAAHYPIIAAGKDVPDSIANVDAILQTDVDRSNHVRRILDKAAELGVPGIDVAYLDLRPEQRTSFTLFVAELADGLHAQGRALSLTLPVPVMGPERIDEGAYNWAELGKSADILQIAPHRDQGTYRLVMPEILDHLTAAVDAGKLVLTVTPYAAEKSQDGIRAVTLTEAMRRASELAIRSSGDATAGAQLVVVGVNIDRDEGLSGIRWQPETATVAYTYKLGGSRTVWIENVFSIAFKLEFAGRYELGGVAVEDASDDPFLGDIWPAIETFVATGEAALVQPNAADLDPRWSATGGSLDDGGRGSVVWTTPAEAGSYSVTLSVSDGVYRFESEIATAVQATEDAARAP